MYDLVVVGSGPAGSTCARKAVLAGLDTAIIEEEKHPREKTCGGAVSSRVEEELGFEIDGIAEREFHSARIHGLESLSVDLKTQGEIGYLVKRARFDSYLLDKAREAGVDVFENCRAVACEQLRRGIRVLCEGDSFKARLVAGADGVKSIVAKSLRMRENWQPDEVAVGIAADVPMKASDIEYISYKDVKGQIGLEIYFGITEWGYGWFFPKQNEISIGLGCRSDKADNFKAKWEAFVQRLENSKGIKLDTSNQTGFRLPFYTKNTKLVTRRTMLMGDAAGLASPITGQGICYAVRSGAIAAQIAKETVEMQRISHIREYENRIRREIEQELEVQRFISETLFQSDERISMLLKLLADDSVLREYAERIILGGNYDNLKRKIIRRMLTRHPLATIRFAI